MSNMKFKFRGPEEFEIIAQDWLDRLEWQNQSIQDALDILSRLCKAEYTYNPLYHVATLTYVGV